MKTLNTQNLLRISRSMEKGQSNLFFFFPCCLLYEIQFKVALLSSTVILSLHLSIFFGAKAFANRLLIVLKSNLVTPFVNWDIALLHMQSGVKGLDADVKGEREEMGRSVCCFPRLLPLSLSLLALSSVLLTSPTFTLVIPLVPSLSFICCAFGN